LHGVWLSNYCRPAVKLKQKTHRRLAVGLIKFVNESKPDCRADQQRVRKQQVQVLIHELKVTPIVRWVKQFLTAKNGEVATSCGFDLTSPQ
jgi:hypothetical protein